MSIAQAVTMVFGPSEASWALFGLAFALALDGVEDLVVTANMRSADAVASRLVVKAEWINACSTNWDAFALFSAPVVVFTSARAVGIGVSALALAIVATPELVISANFFVADAFSDLEVPEFAGSAVSWRNSALT